MKLLKAMRERANFSAAEQNIIQYMMEHSKEIADLSIRALASRSYTSPAVISRLCRKFGLKGYTEFKIKFISEANRTSSFEEVIGERPVTDQDSALSIVKKLAYLEVEAIEETKNELQMKQLVRVANLVAAADQIDFYAYDNNFWTSQAACAHFLRIGKPAFANSATNMQIGQAIASTPRHVAFILSRTGENNKLLRVADILKRKKVPSVIFTVQKTSALARACDEFIYVANAEEFVNLGSLIYGAGVKYVLDVLFGLLLAREYKNVLKLDGAFRHSMGKADDDWRCW